MPDILVQRCNPETTEWETESIMSIGQKVRYWVDYLRDRKHRVLFFEAKPDGSVNIFKLYDDSGLTEAELRMHLPNRRNWSLVTTLKEGGDYEAVIKRNPIEEERGLRFYYPKLSQKER